MKKDVTNAGKVRILMIICMKKDVTNAGKIILMIR